MVVERALRKLSNKEWELLAEKAGWKVEPLAKLLKCSPSALRKFFHRTKRCSPLKWMRGNQLKKALKEVEDNKSVKEAAIDAGLGSSSNLCNLCRTRYGVTPGQVGLGASILHHDSDEPTSPRPRVAA